jgi:hypothetical protein
VCLCIIIDILVAAINLIVLVFLFFLSLHKQMIPQSVIDDDNDHTMHYAQSLPYANLLDKEAEVWLSDICTHLATSVRAQDFTGGALAWVRRLSRYFKKKKKKKNYANDETLIDIKLVTWT